MLTSPKVCFVLRLFEIIPVAREKLLKYYVNYMIY